MPEADRLGFTPKVHTLIAAGDPVRRASLTVRGFDRLPVSLTWRPDAPRAPVA